MLVRLWASVVAVVVALVVDLVAAAVSVVAAAAFPAVVDLAVVSVAALVAPRPPVPLLALEDQVSSPSRLPPRTRSLTSRHPVETALPSFTCAT